MKEIKNCFCLIICLLCLHAYAQPIPFTEEVYNQWVEMRIGDGENPVYWSAHGEIYSYPEGELIAKMTGVDMGVKIQVTPDSVLQTSRKIFIYTDAKTGKILTEYQDAPVKHIQYPYQLIAYVRDKDAMRTWVTQGSGDNIRVIGPGTKITARQLGESMFFAAPLFLNIETPNGKYQAFENYDFFYNPSGVTTEDKYQISWMRYGDAPSFLGKKKAITHMISHRVDSFDDLDPELIAYIQGSAPMWQKPPVSLEEIKSLQQEK